MRIKHLLIALFTCVATAFTATAQNATDGPEVNDGVYKGFVGHPMLKSLGYKAQSGAFSIGVGEGSISNHENIIDNDPNNYASCTNLADLTLVLDNEVKVLVDHDYCAANGIVPRTLGSGVEVGFVFSEEGAVSVLDLDLLKMFVIYFYKGEQLVATKEAKSGEHDVLGLNLISVGGNKMKVTAESPETDKDGNPLEFDGIGFGLAGVDVGVGKQIRLHYGFIDDFATVPIIRKYFNRASSEVAGMVTGGNNLTNNDLEDGATTAVLNIGGAYYTVMSNEPKPFPAGVEAGFTMTSGSVLDLNLGKAVEIIALSYPQKEDGSYDFSADPIEVGKTTGVNVVGVQLIGGGKTKVSMVTEAPCFGFRLNRISVLDLDLGATVVHYAYVKLPQMRSTNYPFEVEMDVVPDCTFTEAKDGVGLLGSNAKNTVKNKIYLRHVAERPIKTKDKMDNIWRHGTLIGYALPKDYVCLTLTRKATNANNADQAAEVAGYVEIIAHNGGYEYRYDKAGTGYSDSYKLPAPNAEGDIDISSIMFYEDPTEVEITTGSTDKDAVKAYEYTLYFTDPKDGFDDIANAIELSYDEAAMPSILPTYEIAGTVTEDLLMSGDNTDSPSASLKPNTYGRYVKITVPDAVDYKTDIKGFDLYKYTANRKAQKVHSYTRNAENKWINENGVCNQVSENGVSQVLYHEANASTNYSYEVVCHGELNPKYAAQNNTTTDNLDFGCVMTAVPEHNVPVVTSSMGQDFTRMMLWVNIQLNEAMDSHRAEYGDILYNQWSTFKASDSSKSITSRSTRFNENDYPGEFTTRYGNGSHHAITFAPINETADIKFPMTYSAYTRAYIPVHPRGYDAAATTYLIADATSTEFRLEDDKTTGVENVTTTDNAPVEYYNLQGIRVDNPEKGVYIRRQGNKVEKVVL